MAALEDGTLDQQSVETTEAIFKRFCTASLSVWQWLTKLEHNRKHI